MGACYEQLRLLDDAAENYRRAAELQPDWIEPRLRQVNVLMIMHKQDEGLSVAEKAVQDFPHNAQVYGVLADVLVAMQKFAEADHVLQLGLANVPEPKHIMIKQLKVWYFLDKYDEMQSTITRLREMELTDDEADAVDQAEGELDVRLEKRDEACAAYERVLSR